MLTEATLNMSYRKKDPEPEHERRLEYGVRDDATWGPKWTDEIKVRGASPESAVNLKRRRRYRGDEHGDVLVAWLNEMVHGRRNRSAYQRICRLLKNVLQLAEVPGDQTRRQEIATSIEKQLHGYSERPQHFVMKTREVGPQGEALDRVRPFFQAVPSGGQTSREQAAVIAILELSQRGLLSNVRRCDWKKCRRWLYPRFPHQRFCREQCKNEYCASKAFKVEHAAKQKKIDELRRSGISLRKRRT